MYWFTYDKEGEQDWHIAEGEVRGNRILFPELIQASGGEFGPNALTLMRRAHVSVTNQRDILHILDTLTTSSRERYRFKSSFRTN